MNTTNNHKNNNDWEEELKNVPLLQKLYTDQPYEAPVGYFDSLASNIMSRIAVEGNSNSKSAVIRPLINYRKWIISSVAVAAVIAAFLLFNKQQQESKMIAMNYDAICNSGLVNGLDESLLIDELSEETSINNISENQDIENYLLETSTEDALINNL